MASYIKLLWVSVQGHDYLTSVGGDMVTGHIILSCPKLLTAVGLETDKVWNMKCYLMGGNIANADISISEVGAELLGLHPLSSCEPTTQSQVDVAVTAVSTLLS